MLCRLALGESSIDPSGFTGIRMLSGALTLWIVIKIAAPDKALALKATFSVKNSKGWLASGLLFIYAAFFSFAYVKLETASGALILFASVQFFMISANVINGYRLAKSEWLGIIISFSGFVLLMLPDATQPSLVGFILMVISGCAWAFYTLAGKNISNATLLTTENFLRCVPMACLFILVSIWADTYTWQGMFYAFLSGAFASGLGYSLWYMALKHLTITQAAISQLSVPLIAAIGGIMFVAESITSELVLSGALILSGIAIVSFKKKN